MKRILIVEDNGDNRYLVRFMLEKDSDIEILEAVSGEEGVELAKKEKPDLILMDIQLPGIDGFETTKRIRDSESNGSIPIVALTSYAMAGDKDKAIKAGCTGYIEKPINPDTFVKQVTEYLSGKEKDKDDKKEGY